MFLEKTKKEIIEAFARREVVEDLVEANSEALLW